MTRWFIVTITLRGTDAAAGGPAEGIKHTPSECGRLCQGKGFWSHSLTRALTCEESYEEWKAHPIRETAGMRVDTAPGGGQHEGMAGLEVSAGLQQPKVFI